MYVLPYGQMSLWGVTPQMVFFWYNVTFQGLIAKLVIAMSRKGIDKDVVSIIFGSLLGNANAEKKNPGGGTRICFSQEDSKLEYSLYLHQILSDRGYCGPKKYTIKKEWVMKGETIKYIKFTTLRCKSLNWIHELWYIDGVKRIPSCISQFLTPLALATWIMNDGVRAGKALKFVNDSYTYHDLLVLVNALYDKFKIESTIHKAPTGKWHIHIWPDSIPVVKKIVEPHIIPEMKYLLDISTV